MKSAEKEKQVVAMYWDKLRENSISRDGDRLIRFTHDEKRYKIEQHILKPDGIPGRHEKTIITYFKRNGVLHKFGGPAIIERTLSGKTGVAYYLDGHRFSGTEYSFFFSRPDA